MEGTYSRVTLTAQIHKNDTKAVPPPSSPPTSTPAPSLCDQPLAARCDSPDISNKRLNNPPNKEAPSEPAMSERNA